MNNFNNFELKALDFLHRLQAQMTAKSIALPSHWSIDHLCYRVELFADYQSKKNIFSSFAKLLGESLVGGRPISAFKLNQPISFLERKIDVIELPAPKASHPRSEGFEHIEVVCDETFDEIKHRFSKCNFKEKGLSKDFNPELELVLNGMSIKFHHQSLESVVTLESNRKVFFTIETSNVLNQLKQFSPIIVGTYPLDLHTETSDVDILLCSQRPEDALNVIKLLYAHLPKFQIHQEANFSTIKFEIANVPFEFYISSTPTLKQRGFLHFQIEERLLKLGGDTFRQRVKERRSQGYKTEPAFAEVLGLSGNPYIELLRLHTATERDLEALIEPSFYK